MHACFIILPYITILVKCNLVNITYIIPSHLNVDCYIHSNYQPRILIRVLFLPHHQLLENFIKSSLPIVPSLNNLSIFWFCLRICPQIISTIVNHIVGGKNLSSQLQNATLKFSDKFQINVIKLIKLDDDMCHPNWHHIDISKSATCHLAHKIKINFIFKIYG